MKGRAAIVTSAGTGGVERFSSLLARALEARGWEAELVSTDRVPARWVARLGGGALQMGRWLSQAVERIDPDVVITNGELGALHSQRRPRIHVYHGTMVGHTMADRGPPLRQRARVLVGHGLAEALSARGATRVAVSEGAKREVERCFRARVDAVIPNGVDVDCFRPRDRGAARTALDLDAHAHYALYVGRVEGRKGGDLLEPAARGGGFELLVAGRDAPPGARHLGSLAPERLALAYAAADVVLFPTRYEGCSFVVLEALACGTPLVTTAVGWMPEFLRALPDYRRLVVAPEVEDISARLRTLDLSDLDGLTGAAREWIAAHNSLAVFDRTWGELVDRVAGRTPPARVRDPEARAA
ncbi:MAG: glycosyltransferase family 4 protein [Solirubrobacteraceae bacterium]